MTKKLSFLSLGFMILMIGMLMSGGCGQGQKAADENSNLTLLVSPEAVILMTGSTQQFAYSIMTASLMSTADVVWTVVGGVGTIDATGLFTAVAEGEGTIEARVGSAIGRARVTVSGGGRSYFPSKDGYSWKWDSPSISYLVTVEGTEQIDSISTQVGKITFISNDFTGTLKTYWKIDDTGVYYYPDGVSSESFTILNFPLEVGKTWECNSPSGSYYPTTVTVIASENIITLAGIFDCYKVSYVAGGGTTYYWFGNGAGAIKALMAGSTEEVSLV